MKKHIQALVLTAAVILTCLPGCSRSGADAASAQDAAPPSEVSADFSAETGPGHGKESPAAHLIADDARSGIILFADGDVTGWNNYENGAAVRTLQNCLVNVLLTFRMAEDWSLVYAKNMGDSCDDYCWVRTDELKPYDPAAMEDRLTWPVRVRPGTVLIDEVRGTEWTADDRDIWLTRRNGAYVIQMEGGIDCPVSYEDIVFPRIENNAVVWD